MQCDAALISDVCAVSALVSFAEEHHIVTMMRWTMTLEGCSMSHSAMLQKK